MASAIVWETEQGAIPWSHWNGVQRRALEYAFIAERAALQGRGDPLDFPLHDPPPNLAAKERSLTVLAPTDAWRLYVAHVGHSLALEIAQSAPQALR